MGCPVGWVLFLFFRLLGTCECVWLWHMRHADGYTQCRVGFGVAERVYYLLMRGVKAEAGRGQEG